jgi:non-specific serine/threonine protein kinase/serine/threonine-protein kinase
MDEADALYEQPAIAMEGAAEALADAAGDRRAAPGERIGPYRIIRELGRGGMGSVYLAERADGEFDKQVAIKFIGGPLSDPLLRRFREERRILAALDHPNISRLLDGGTTDDGRPYVVMEFVQGVPIDSFCEQRRLDVRARIALFQQVCAAVQYAHQRLVIHRDIKAANILVTGDGTPKLLDFGIATFIEADVARRSTVTLLRAVTLDSASPEQVRGEVVTVVADVYALGVLLYRLLTGRTPYGDADTGSALLRAICDGTPPPPGVSRDLDLIVLKALRKEPERRYESPAQFSDDLTRYLDGRPVLAAPDSTAYRTRKFVRRHRIPLAAAAVALAAIVGGAAAAVDQARAARRERARAEERLADVRHLASDFVFEFHDAIADLPGSLKPRQLVVQRAAEYLDRLARESEGDLQLQRELAGSYLRLGDITGGPGGSNLGDLDGARARYETALKIRDRLAAAGSATPDDLAGGADIRVRLSRVLAATMDLEGSERQARSAVEMLRPHAADPQIGTHIAGSLATAYQQLGFVQALRGDSPAAAESLRHAVEHGESSVHAHPGDAREAVRLGRIRADYAEQLIALNRTAEAIQHARAAEREVDARIRAEPANQRYRLTLLYALNAQGRALQRSKDSAGAVAVFERAVQLADAIRDASPDDQGFAFAAAYYQHALGGALVDAGRVRAAIPHLTRAVQAEAAIVERAPGNDYFRYALSTASLTLGRALTDIHAARPALCQAIAPGLGAWRELSAQQRLPPDADELRDTYARLRDRCR